MGKGEIDKFGFVFSILSVGKDKFDKLGFVELEQTLFCDRYLELVETMGLCQ